MGLKFKEKLGHCPIPAWLFAVVTVVYCESLLHLRDQGRRGQERVQEWPGL